MALKTQRNKSEIAKDVIDIGLEQVTLEMSKLLKEFHKNLKNLSIVSINKPLSREKCDNSYSSTPGSKVLPSCDNNPKNEETRKSSPKQKQKKDVKDPPPTSRRPSTPSSNSSKVSGDHKKPQKPKDWNNKWKTFSDNRSKPQSTPLVKRPKLHETRQDELRAMKELVEQAKSERKTFTICGNYMSIRRALLARGWIEKIRLSYNTRDRENLRRLQSMQIADLLYRVKDKTIGTACRRMIMSKLLYNHQVDFYWDDFNDAFKVNDDKVKFTLINKFKRTSFSYTSKQGLCEAVKRAHWYQKPGTSVIRHPRSYSLTNRGDPNEFVEDYKQTAAISLLKWVVATSKDPKGKLMSDTGKIPLSALDFAVEECVKIIKKAKHEDIDCDIEPAMDYQWNQFLDHYYKLVHIGNHFRKYKAETEASVAQKAQFIMNKLEKHIPNLDMDGMMNIWILKPIAGSRGLGIHICRTLQYILQVVQANTNMRYVVQKYIEKPLLIYNTKFDIRQWFLISSACPLTIWIYKECYLRFSSQTYNLRKLHESIHLTNNSVQCKYKNNGKDVALPNYNMWDSDEFKRYLKNVGYCDVYDKVIYPGMKQCITGAILLNQENLDPRRNSFELYGADFMLTEDFHPWLIEINAKPALYGSTPVTARMCPQVLEDVVKVIIDVPKKPRANTGNFELLYKQNIPKLPRVNADALKLKGTPLKRGYFCNAGAAAPEAELAAMSKENVKITEIQDYISKVNSEMNSALRNLLSVIDKERQRKKHTNYSVESAPVNEPVTVGELEEVDSRGATPAPSEVVLEESKNMQLVQAEQNGVFRNIINFLKSVRSNASETKTTTL